MLRAEGHWAPTGVFFYREGMRGTPTVLPLFGCLVFFLVGLGKGCGDDDWLFVPYKVH